MTLILTWIESLHRARYGTDRWAHDLTAARELVLPAVYPDAARGLPVLADKGYTGTGVGVHTPSSARPAARCCTDTGPATGCLPR